MNSSIQPSTLAGASIVIQVSLLIISYIALIILSKSYIFNSVAKDAYSTLVAWLILTLVLILLGEDQYLTWGPILGPVTLPTISRDSSYLSVFVLDIFFVTFLALKTGGTKRSPFTSVLFLLPSLAIFLHEPTYRFLGYSIAVGLVYVIVLKRKLVTQKDDFNRRTFDGPTREADKIDDLATIWTNLSCLFLGTLIGYIAQRSL